MGRAVSEKFLNDLLEGELSSLLDVVHNDTTLIMELRGNCVVIYYRGGALFTIKENTDTGYTVSYNSAYWAIKKKYDELEEIPSITDCVKYIALYKDQIDYHMANADRTLEKQSQQRLVLENNVLGKVVQAGGKNKSATTGDYFILDTEYAYRKPQVIDARFDAVALKWPSLSNKRKKRSGLGISFIEVKYYDYAMSGKAGIEKHIDDYLAFTEMKGYHDMCRDMEKVFYQKCKLGLIPAYTSRLSKDEKYYMVSIDDNNVDFVFMFVNRDPDSIVAKRELAKSIEKHGKEKTSKIFVANSSDIGYTMFRYSEMGSIDRYVGIEEYVNS